MEEIFEKILSACNKIDVSDKDSFREARLALIEMIDLYNSEVLRLVGSDKEFKHKGETLDRNDILWLDWNNNVIRFLGYGRSEIYASRIC